MRFRAAVPDDAEDVALLHADSWRRYYRGAYADSFLDGDVVADRRTTWSSRFAAPANSMTVVAADDTGLTGFVHVIFDDDDTWGSLVDNLHVVHNRHRTGLGSALLVRAAQAVADRAIGKSVHVWVLEQNTAAQRFYRALGGTNAEKAPVSPPGGLPDRLNGSPSMLRFVWPDAASLAGAR
ncbi:GNAT family N-acetyltransferase [Actinophytocola sp.]|uniref:GNAT family N-acetyltransferase n=1 Tax=Actinophytocola sp. TaxID=1872138 RepID=UPI002EDA159D